MRGITQARVSVLLATFAVSTFQIAQPVNAAVGVTLGAPSVSATGAAGYEIPLTLPPGTNSLTPSLSLRYTHTLDSGLFGVGWSLTGLSAISRCNKTVAQDGSPSAATLAVSDGYCLDGNRLRLTGGTYGAAGSTYQTEIETFSRVLAQGTAGNGPASWEVRGKNGLIYEYGNTVDSRIESVGSSTARLWALNRVRDRVGNYIEIIYTEDVTNGSFRPDKIRYTGHSTLGTTPATEVQFLYETVPVGEVDSEYFAGGLIKRITRADRIDVKHNGTTLVRRYELTYEGPLSSTSKSRLASIQECAGITPDCFPATTFVYQNGTSGLGSETNTGQSVPTAPWSIDVNGDGRRDLVYSSSTTSGGGTWMVMLANASGSYNAPINTGITNTNYSGATPIDYNADGLQDLLVPYSGGTWWVMLGTTSGLGSPSNTGAPVTTTGSGSNAVATDVDGDGLQDLVWADLYGYVGGDVIRYRLRVWGGAFSSTVYNLIAPYPADDGTVAYAISNGLSAMRAGTGPVTDFNSDGRGDVAYRYTRRVWNEGTGQYSYFYTIVGVCPGAWTFGTSTSAASGLGLGDFNGDAKTDIIYYTSTTAISMRLSNGNSFTAPIGIGSISSYTPTWTILDWDSDGYDDLMLPHISSGLWHLFRSTGETLSAPVSTGLSSSGASVATASDLNGDGMRDLGYRVSGAWRYRPHAGSYPDLLQTATDGFGNAVTFNYAPLTDTSFYTKGTGSTFPLQEYTGGTWVVKNSTGSNGIGGTYTRTFSWTAARLHLQGRGFLGFATKYEIDSRDNVVNSQDFRQDFPYIGVPWYVLRRQSDWTTKIAEQTDTLSNVLYSSGYNARYFPYVSQRIVKRYEAGGTYNGSLLSTATTTNAVDSTSGTLFDSTTTTVEAVTANGVQAGASYSQRVYHPTAYFLNDTSSNWCIGRPGRTELINSHTQYGGSSITRTVSRSWDTVNCRVTQEIIEPDSTQWKVTRDLGYDGWGNVSSDTVTGIGMAARTTTANWGSTGRFLQSVTNPLSQTTQFGWDATIGTLTSTTDPNGIATSWQYDIFGRRTREDRPDSTASTWSYNDCASYGCVNANNKMLVIATLLDTADVFVSDQWTYLDKFNRPIVSSARLLSGSYNRSDREYDALGRISRESAPCWWSGCTNYWTTYAYDLLNRPTQVSRPVSDSDPTIQTSYSYFEGLTTRSVDALGKQSTKVVNVLGGPARSTDHNGYYQSFDVDAFGNTVRVTDSLSNTLQSITYNVRGMKTAQTDMDMGSWSFTPNALGEVASQTDAKSQNTTFVFDKLSRLTSRTEAEGTSTWTWGTSAAAKNIGRLQSLSGPGYAESFTYDSIGRPQQRAITSDTTYSIDYAYNAIGQLDALTYPTSTAGYRLKLKYEYQNGVLLRVKDFNAPTTVFWQANATDPRGSIIDESLGNGLQTIRGFDLVTGWIDSIQTGPGGGASIQNLSYAWDKVGNLTQRQDLRQSLTEAFYYDHLHRLDYSTLNGATNLDLAYDALGNITMKSDVCPSPPTPCYSYHATKKHAVTAAGSYTFAYDANGNVSARNGFTLSWYSYNLPNTISASGSNSSQFFYAPDRARWKQVASYGGTTETTIYIGGLIEKVTLGAVTSWKHYIAGASGPVALYTRKSGAADEMHYLTRDHLGSVDSVTTGSGAVEVRLSFASFGQRRKEAGWAGNPTAGDWSEITDTTRRGFTFHEMLDNLNLTHMNGRVYDQVVGRFLSADPFVQAPSFTQSFNRYSYTWGNPLSFTDPSGFDNALHELPVNHAVSSMGSMTVKASRTISPLIGLGIGPLTGGSFEVADEVGTEAIEGGTPAASSPKDDKKEDSKEETQEEQRQEEEPQDNKCPKSFSLGLSAEAQAAIGILGGDLSIEVGVNSNLQIYVRLTGAGGLGLGLGLAGGFGGTGSWGSSMHSGQNLDTGGTIFGGFVSGGGLTGSYQQSHAGGGSITPPSRAGRISGSVGLYGGLFVGEYGSVSLATPALLCSAD